MTTFLLQLFNSAVGHLFFRRRRPSLLHRHSHLLTLRKMAASVKIDDSALTLRYHVPNPNRREWIRRFFSKLEKFIVDSSVNNSLLRLKGNTINMGYFLSPGDQSYDALGLMKQLSEHIYMTSDGRISMAGLSSKTVPHFADAIHVAVTRFR